MGADVRHVTVNITQILPALLGSHKTDINSVATVLDLHPKKLQRLLKEEGTNFSELVEDVRRTMAARLLTETDLSIGHIAKMLDYTTDRSFGVAVKRWFNMTPTEYRKQRYEDV